MKVQLYRDRVKRWRWRFVECGRVVADSGHGYARSAPMLRALQNIFEQCKRYGLLRLIQHGGK